MILPFLFQTGLEFYSEIRVQTVMVIEHGDVENYIIFWKSLGTLFMFL